MDHKSNAASEPTVPRIGLVRDLRRLKADGTDTASELREFIQQLRGKPAQEMLGLVAQSGLLRATATATVGTVILLAGLTVIPYTLAKAFPEKPKPAAAAAGDAAANDQAPAATATGDAPATTGATAAATSTGNAPITAEQGEVLLDKLGEGETRDSDPTVNPLEESADDLLDDLN